MALLGEECFQRRALSVDILSPLPVRSLLPACGLRCELPASALSIQLLSPTPSLHHRGLHSAMSSNKLVLL